MLKFLRVAALLLPLVGGLRKLRTVLWTIDCQHSSSWESCHHPLPPSSFVRNQHWLFMKIYGEAVKHWALKQNSGELSTLHRRSMKVVWMIKHHFLSPLAPIGIPNLNPVQEEKQRCMAFWPFSFFFWEETLALFVASHMEEKGQDKWIVSRSLAFRAHSCLLSARGLLGRVINVLRLDQGSPWLDLGLWDLMPEATLDSSFTSLPSKEYKLQNLGSNLLETLKHL